MSEAEKTVNLARLYNKEEERIILTAAAETQDHQKGPGESLWSCFHRALWKIQEDKINLK